MKTRPLILFLAFISLAPCKAQTPANPPAGKDVSVQPLLDALEKNDLNQMKMLIDQGAPVNATVGGNGYAYTPLTDAADNGKVEALKYLIARGAKPDLPDSQGSTPLLHACSTDHTDCALALLDANANPNLGSQWHRYPLMYAAQKGNDQIVAALIAHHVNLDATNEDGPAIWWTLGDHHFSTFKLLVEAGANLDLKPAHAAGDPRLPQMCLLAYPASVSDVDTMELLLAHGVDVNQTAADGTTALIETAAFDQPEAAKWLLSKGAKVDEQNQRGLTALMVGAMYRKQDIVQTLLDGGAAIDLQDKSGKTALMWACRNGAEGVATVLINHGADINLTDALGETALTYAGNIGHTYLVGLLTSKGAKRTDLHIVVEAQPPVPLSPAQSWALGLCAIYTQANGLNHKFLGGNPDNSTDAPAMLRKSWGITDKASFLKELNDLTETGHRVRYQAEGLELSRMSDADFNQVLVAHPDNATRLKALRTSYLNWNEKSGYAWDMCRAANLINNGYVAGYLSADEAWGLLLTLGRAVQEHFSSWKEMSDNFLDGREIWDNRRDPKFEACAQLLLNPNDRNSPWNENPWGTSLTSTK